MGSFKEAISASLAEPGDSATQLLPFAGCQYHSSRWRSLASPPLIRRNPLKARAADHVFCILRTEFGRASLSNRFREQRPCRIRTRRSSCSPPSKLRLLSNGNDAPTPRKVKLIILHTRKQMRTRGE